MSYNMVEKHSKAYPYYACFYVGETKIRYNLSTKSTDDYGGYLNIMKGRALIGNIVATVFTSNRANHYEV